MVKRHNWKLVSEVRLSLETVPVRVRILSEFWGYPIGSLNLGSSRQCPVLSPSSKCLCHILEPQQLRISVSRSTSFKDMCAWAVAKTTKHSLSILVKTNSICCVIRHTTYMKLQFVQTTRAHPRAMNRDYNLFWKCHTELSYKISVGFLGHQGAFS